MASSDARPHPTAHPDRPHVYERQQLDVRPLATTDAAVIFRQTPLRYTEDSE
jgi:hypothetical protein